MRIKVDIKNQIMRYKIQNKSKQNKTNFFLKDIQIKSIIKRIPLCFFLPCFNFKIFILKPNRIAGWVEKKGLLLYYKLFILVFFFNKSN